MGIDIDFGQAIGHGVDMELMNDMGIWGDIEHE
jgi:hypothetical protein